MGMRVFNIGTLRGYGEQFPDAAEELDAWHKIVTKTEFRHFADIQAVFNDASWIGKPDYVVFNIRHNRYRLIVRVKFEGKAILLHEFLPHKLYDAWVPPKPS